MSDTQQFADPTLPLHDDTDLDVRFADLPGTEGWRSCTITGRVGGYQLRACGTGSRDERAFGYALEVLARQVLAAFPRLYVQ